MVYLLYWFTESDKERHCLRAKDKDYLITYAKENLDNDPDVADYEFYVPESALNSSERTVEFLENKISDALFHLQKPHTYKL